MRAVITRVQSASVRVQGDLVGSIGPGICALVGVCKQDELRDVTWLADKICACRFFKDEAGKMNRSLLEQPNPAVLAVSQFTLYGDLRKGNRPSFSAAMPGDAALAVFESFCERLSQAGVRVQTGRFGADMAVESLNDGPVTLLLDSQKTF